MRTQAFKGDVKKIQYGTNVVKSKKENTPDKTQYFARLLLTEVRKGKTHKTIHHKGILYLTEEQYESKFIEIGDRLQVSDKVQWESRNLSYTSYSEEVVNKMLKNPFECQNVMYDQDGKKYWKTYEYAYSFRAKIDEITLFEKHDKIAYWQLDKIKFYMPAEDAIRLFTNTDPYCAYIFKDNYKNYDYVINKLKMLNGQMENVHLYIHNNKKKTENIRVLVAFDSDINEYYINLKKEKIDAKET